MQRVPLDQVPSTSVDSFIGLSAVAFEAQARLENRGTMPGGFDGFQLEFDDLHDRAYRYVVMFARTAGEPAPRNDQDPELIEEFWSDPRDEQKT
jgi:hypothetical protein